MSRSRCINLRGKKGFTLIELVVVIAIIAVIAAIAIPAIISIINAATSSSIDTEAASMDQACKTYYMGVKSGEINSANFTAPISGDVIPARFVSTGNRNRCAQNCTVAGALEYSGLGELLGRLGEFGYDSEGNICALGNPPAAGLTPLNPNGTDTFTVLNYAN